MIELILFFISIVVGVFFIISALSLVRMKMGTQLHKSLLIQPYGGDVVPKNYLLGLAFLETPVILTVVIGILSFDFFNYHNFYLIYMPAVYVFFFSLSAAITIFFSGCNLGYFISLFADHPQFESQFIIQFLVLISTLQAPFLIFFVSLIYHKYFLIYNMRLFYFEDGFYIFTIALFSMLLMIQYFLSLAISRVIKLLKKVYIDYPYNIHSLFVFLIMQMGFLQAPFIFAFIVFIILGKIFYFKFYFLYYVFSLIAILFGIVAGSVVYSSGKIVAVTFDKLDHNVSKNISLMKFVLVSQLLIDSRILYILLIILFGINFFN